MTKAILLTLMLEGYLQIALAMPPGYDTLAISRSLEAYTLNEISKDSLVRIYCYEAQKASHALQYKVAKSLLRSGENLLSDSTSLLFAEISFLKAVLAMEEDNRVEAIALLMNTLSIYGESQDSLNYLATIRKIGQNYDYLGQHDMARTFYQEGVELASRLSKWSAKACCLYNIGGTYGDDRDFERAFDYYQQAVVIAKDIEDLKLLHKIYHAQAIDYRRLGQMELAEFYSRKSLAISTNMQDLCSMGFSYQGLGYIFFETGELDSAEYYMKKALALSSQVQNYQLKNSARTVLERVYYETGRFQLAYDTYKLMVSQKDSLYNLENSKVVAAIRERYLNEKQEHELAEKNLQLESVSSDMASQRNLQVILVISVLFLIAVVFLIYRSYLERKRTNEKLCAKNQEIAKHLKEIEDVTSNKSKWFVNVAHELRTPLTLIKDPIQKILRSAELTTAMRSDLQLVDRNTRRLIKMVNEILDLSKMEEGEVQMKESVFALDGLVKLVVSAFESRAEQMGLQLHSKMTAEDKISADYEKLEKVIVNLISNALKFTPRGGTIEVFVTKSRDNCLKVVVKDTGNGIHPKDIDFIFDRFYQSKYSNDAMGGTGIGLALSKEIAEMHGGELKVTSTPGMGSTFTLTLPEELITEGKTYLPAVEESTAQAPEVSGSNTNLPAIDRKPILLLLEDNEDMTSYIVSLLAPYFQVKHEATGLQGLDVLHKHDVKFIISDIMMSEMDGISFLKEVKQNTNWRHVPFIHLTALNDENLRKELFQIGVDGYLLKPFDSEELIIRVRNLYHNYIQRVSLSQEVKPASFDEKVIARLKERVLEKIADTGFNVLRLADAAAMSERQLYRYLKATTGFTPLQFIQEIKLTHANDLARKKAYTSISELSLAVGFKNASYFSNLFEKRFGKKPGTILKA